MLQSLRFLHLVLQNISNSPLEPSSPKILPKWPYMDLPHPYKVREQYRGNEGPKVLIFTKLFPLWGVYKAPRWQSEFHLDEDRLRVVWWELYYYSKVGDLKLLSHKMLHQSDVEKVLIGLFGGEHKMLAFKMLCILDLDTKKKSLLLHRGELKMPMLKML